jgi:hypothetical protein
LPLALGSPKFNLSALADDDDFRGAAFQVGLNPLDYTLLSVAVEEYLDTKVGHERHWVVAVETFPFSVWHPDNVRDSDAK